MSHRNKRPRQRRRSKVDQRGPWLRRLRQVREYLLIVDAVWRLLKELIGDDPWNPLGRRVSHLQCGALARGLSVRRTWRSASAGVAPGHDAWRIARYHAERRQLRRVYGQDWRKIAGCDGATPPSRRDAAPNPRSPGDVAASRLSAFRHSGKIACHACGWPSVRPMALQAGSAALLLSGDDRSRPALLPGSDAMCRRRCSIAGGPLHDRRTFADRCANQPAACLSCRQAHVR